MPGYYPCFLNVFLTMCGVGPLPPLRSLPLMLMSHVCSVSFPYSGSLPLFCVIQPIHKLCQVTTSALIYSFMCLLAIHCLCSVTTLVCTFYSWVMSGHYPCYLFLSGHYPSESVLYLTIHWCAGSLPLLPVHFSVNHVTTPAILFVSGHYPFLKKTFWCRVSTPATRVFIAHGPCRVTTPALYLFVLVTAHVCQLQITNTVAWNYKC
jgi:hypothetical protein